MTINEQIQALPPLKQRKFADILFDIVGGQYDYYNGLNMEDCLKMCLATDEQKELALKSLERK